MCRPRQSARTRHANRRAGRAVLNQGWGKRKPASGRARSAHQNPLSPTQTGHRYPSVNVWPPEKARFPGKPFSTGPQLLGHHPGGGCVMAAAPSAEEIWPVTPIPVGHGRSHRPRRPGDGSVGVGTQPREATSSAQAASQRRQASAQIRQCSCMDACCSHSSAHALHAIWQALIASKVMFAS